LPTLARVFRPTRNYSDSLNYRKRLNVARWTRCRYLLQCEKAALLPVRPRLALTHLLRRHPPYFRREAGNRSVRLLRKGRQDAGSDCRCGNGRVDGRIGAATVRRLRIGRYLRADEGASTAGAGLNIPPNGARIC